MKQAGPGVALVAVKTVHTIAWLSIESCLLAVLYTGVTGRAGRRTAMAAAVVTGETLIFAANGFRCPLTIVAERLGAERGSVTDIYLPRWLARNLPAIHVPLLLLAVFLHRGNIGPASLRRYRARRRAGSAPRPPRHHHDQEMQDELTGSRPRPPGHHRS
jgi:hypothetical protein